MTESATHSPTPWREALDRLHYNARCNENRWHDTPLNADRDKEAVFLAHYEMVEALKAAEEHLQFVASSRCEAGGGRECGRSVCQHVGCLAEKRRKVSAALSKSTPTQKGE